MGHVNNAVFVTYFEMGRVALFEALYRTRRFEELDFIMARVEVDFLRPVRLHDRVELGLRVASLGTTSFTLEYLLAAGGEAAARGRSVQVFYDYAQGAKKPVPERFRAAAAAYLTPGGPC